MKRQKHMAKKEQLMHGNFHKQSERWKRSDLTYNTRFKRRRA